MGITQLGDLKGEKINDKDTEEVYGISSSSSTWNGGNRMGGDYS